jgi:lipopolysaccharide biosynthesis regulator YciM
MAGSYSHCVDDKGNLLSNDEMMISGAMIENLGDAYEAIEEMYGMIWWLASRLVPRTNPGAMKVVVEVARNSYKEGLRVAEEVNSSS